MTPWLYGPHHCPLCTGENYYGRWVHRGEAEQPTCPNHPEGVTVVLVPGSGAKVDDTVWTDGRHLQPRA